MIRSEVICDRCKKKCEGSTYYTVDIYGHDINPAHDFGWSMETATQNVNTNMAKVFGTANHYCKSCKDKIEKFLQHLDSEVSDDSR